MSEGGRTYIRTLYDFGNWFLVSKHLLLAFTLEEAFLLSWLINKDNMEEQETKKRQDRGKLNKYDKLGGKIGPQWFYCKAASVMNATGIQKRQHDRIFNGLRSKGVVETKMVGIPAIRFLRINYEKMQELVQTAYESRIS